MYISYDYYRIFYYVAKYGNISQAAKMLLSNQPNLTRTIKNLEAALGCPLFLRTYRGMKLTPEGEKLYAHVRIAFENIEAGEAELTESKNLQSGSISIAASEVALRCLLLPVLKQFRKHHPGVQIRISNHSTPQAITALKEGTAELAVVTTPTVKSPSLIEKSIKEIHEVAVCGTAFEDLCRGKTKLASLSDHPIISLGAETKTFEFYSEFFMGLGLNYTPSIEAATADQILPMVEANLGIGFVPREFIRTADEVSVIDLEEEIPARSICLIKRKEQPLSVAAKRVEKLIIEAD